MESQLCGLCVGNLDGETLFLYEKSRKEPLGAFVVLKKKSQGITSDFSDQALEIESQFVCLPNVIWNN